MRIINIDWLEIYCIEPNDEPRNAEFFKTQGYEVEGGLANAQPGDLVCYSGHVALYIGDGKIIHASGAATGIKISNYDYEQPAAIGTFME